MGEVLLMRFLLATPSLFLSYESSLSVCSHVYELVQ